MSPFRSDMDFQQFMVKVNEVKASVEHLSRQIDRETQLAERADTKTILKNLNDLQTPVDRLHVINERMYVQQKEGVKTEALRWISDISYANHFSRASSKILDGTGEWLFKSAEFRKWRSSDTAEILRIHGKAGSGKSTLLWDVPCQNSMRLLTLCRSIVLKRLRQDCERRGSPPPAYFYCARTSEEPQRSQPSHVLRCLLAQLSQIPGSSHIQQSVFQRYESRQSNGELQDRETIDLCVKSIDSRGPTFILVDALDESDSTCRDVLLGGLVRLLKKSTQVVKLFVTSRDKRNESMIMDYPEVVIDPEINGDDIKLYVDAELERMESGKVIPIGRLPTDLRDLVKDELVKKADGM